jgi:DNA-binding transcriptional ArsR family regulator
MTVNLSTRTSTILQTVRHSTLGTAVRISSQQCRAIHLYYAASTHEHQSNHKIKAFSSYEGYTPQKNVRLGLWSEGGKKLIKKTTLSDVYSNDLKPGRLLVPLVDPATKKPRDGQYMMEEIDINRGIPVKPRTPGPKLFRGRGSKQVHFKVSVPPAHFQVIMWKAWHMLTRKEVVEFHIHLQEPLKSQEEELFNEALNHPNAIHLRPDVLLRSLSMEGVQNIITPWADWTTQCAWVTALARPGQATTRQLEKNLQIQLQMERRGAGIPLREERLRLKKERKAEPGFRSHSQARRDAFAEIRLKQRALEPLVRRISERYTTGAELLNTARSLQTRQEVLAPLAQEDPEVFKLASRSMKPADAISTLYKKLYEARKTIRNKEINEAHRLNVANFTALQDGSMSKDKEGQGAAASNGGRDRGESDKPSLLPVRFTPSNSRPSQNVEEGFLSPRFPPKDQ